MSDRIGEIGINNRGSQMVIEEYNNDNDLVVRFVENGNLASTRYSNFKIGNVKNPFDKSVCGIGYLGEGEYKSNVEGKPTKQYNSWVAMIHRCYSEVSFKRHPSYKGCSVDPEWHNFQNFARWYTENYYEVDGEKVELDKDILVKGNRIYSPETCIFVPKRINVLFVKREEYRGLLPIGVSWSDQSNKYQVHCKDKGKLIPLGFYDTVEEAFEVYKTYKENLIKEIAEEYKSRIPVNLYEAMISYSVEMTD